MTWIADPVTKQPIGPIPSETPETRRAFLARTGHWREGWRTGMERDADGRVVRIWYAECRDSCCAAVLDA